MPGVILKAAGAPPSPASPVPFLHPLILRQPPLPSSPPLLSSRLCLSTRSYKERPEGERERQERGEQLIDGLKKSGQSTVRGKSKR